MPARSNNSIESILEEWGYLTAEQREQIMSEQAATGRPAEEIIVAERMAPEEQVYRAKGAYLGIPFVDLKERETDMEAAKEIPADVSRNYNLLAFEKSNGVLKVAMAQPDDFQALEALKFLTKKTGLKVSYHIATLTDITDAISKATGGLSGEVETAIREFNQDVEQAEEEVTKEDRDVEKIVGEAPVTKAVAVILRHAIEGRASDVHIEPMKDNVRVRFRVDGLLYTSLVLPLKLHEPLISRIKILSNLRIDEQRVPQDGRFSTTAGGHEYDLRVAVMPASNGEKVVMRILDKSEGAVPFEKLGYAGKALEDFQSALKRPHGLILITGPTGSGKSTTLFTATDSISSNGVNLVTLEDPVEYQIAGANQSQVNPEIGFSFASGLRSILRQDPDIIMVGEIRDKETGELVVHSALTGHLVLSTLHTNDAVGAIPRLMDMGLEPFLLAAIMRLVGAQRLVKRICPSCKEEVPIPAEFAAAVKKEVDAIPESYKALPNQKEPKTLFRGKGCKECAQKGTKGRLAIVEIFPITEKLRKAIIEKTSYDDLKKMVAQEGSISMRQDGFLKALAGMVTLEDVLEATSED